MASNLWNCPVAEVDHTGNPQQPTKPLIRLRVDYAGGFESLSVQRYVPEPCYDAKNFFERLSYLYKCESL